MSERITNATLEARAHNLNARIVTTGRHVQVGYRNGYAALDEYRGADCIRTITVGTRRELADFLHAMMTGIDLSREMSS